MMGKNKVRYMLRVEQTSFTLIDPSTSLANALAVSKHQEKCLGSQVLEFLIAIYSGIQYRP